MRRALWTDHLAQKTLVPERLSSALPPQPHLRVDLPLRCTRSHHGRKFLPLVAGHRWDVFGGVPWAPRRDLWRSSAGCGARWRPEPYLQRDIAARERQPPPPGAALLFSRIESGRERWFQEFRLTLANRVFETIESVQDALTRVLEPYWEEPLPVYGAYPASLGGRRPSIRCAINDLDRYYSAECVEGKFCELRLHRILGS